MKASRLPFLFISTLIITFSACEKNTEITKNVSELKATTTSKVVYPLIGTDLSGNILTKKKLPRAVVTKGSDYPNISVQLIDTVCAAYLQGTKKFDLSNIQEGSVTFRVTSDDNNLVADPDFHDYGFAKLSNGPKGWWTHWNYSPYTESENPIVLFALNRRIPELTPVSSISIYLTASVKTFGFEIAPNAIGKNLKVLVTYKDLPTYRAQTLFDVQQTISSPSGARLIAVKSDVPFDYLLIEVNDDPDHPQGFAIANIRYGLPYKKG
jgi:hypothetical protein